MKSFRYFCPPCIFSFLFITFISREYCWGKKVNRNGLDIFAPFCCYPPPSFLCIICQMPFTKSRSININLSISSAPLYLEPVDSRLIRSTARWRHFYVALPKISFNDFPISRHAKVPLSFFTCTFPSILRPSQYKKGSPSSTRWRIFVAKKERKKSRSKVH